MASSHGNPQPRWDSDPGQDVGAEEDRWIGDYRSIGLTEWPQALRERVTALHRRSTWRRRWWLISLLVPVAIVFAGVPIIQDLRPQTGAVIGNVIVTVCVVVSVALVMVGLLLAIDHDKFRVRSKGALKRDKIECFVLGEHIQAEAAAAEALGQPIPYAGAPREIWLDPKTCAVLCVGDRVPRLLPIVAVRTITRMQSSLVAQHITEPVSPLPLIEPAQGPVSPRAKECASERTLDAAEIKEFAGYVKRASLNADPMYYFVYAAVMVALPVMVVLIWTGYVHLWPHVISSGLAALWMTYRAKRFCKSRAWVRVLRRDLKRGVVEIIDGYDAIADFGPLPPGVPKPIPPEVVHRLPESGVWWEADGVPAAWRR
ncbi:MAG: hypothetical protein H6815_01780 [Phycisphaeraceae bacterium]|nr:hypothetical protein [Phycisphaerales bacterium]MCB9859158.1 hypothetical protein [Phycisphaeraceae bacterium]